ncbi:carbohydrate ABC transporter permease [Brachybacterium sp. UMB0905]|uniref:carbohydrate ABC transporter permease n=1 Tax=Brachybacterium sp. UMB0905 TaxID=2069310 RepID=UPI0018EB1B87|nr:carbohydrate ABC transporter permease [Brachybacterium sp. UMB0905]
MAARRPPWMEKPGPITQALKVLAIAIIVLLMLYPFVYVIMASMTPPGETLRFGVIPTDMTLDAYRSVLAGRIIPRALMVSIGITAVGTVLSVTFTTLLAFGLTRTREIPGSKGVLYLVLFTMLFGAGLIPNFILVKSLGLLNSYWALILPGLISAFNMLVVRNFFMQIPQELTDSARIDGASDLQVFGKIMLPLSKAVIAVVALFYAVGYWNNFFSALIYLQDTSKWPIQMVLNTYAVQGSPISNIENPNAAGSMTPQAIQMAIVVLATVPILCVYPFAQRFFTKGVLTGAIKG